MSKRKGAHPFGMSATSAPEESRLYSMNRNPFLSVFRVKCFQLRVLVGVLAELATLLASSTQLKSPDYLSWRVLKIEL